jgi:alkanesulfonate monooxygenase SsuD/methylene tetrahydromethanopterin reductase-like flavin-dependent oxidoreductase (luciferase family)
MMRFGHFFYPMNFDPARDYQVITDCLAEAALVEQLGLDAIWMAEHHFTGETVYGDALVFAAAVAMKTQRILLGLGVVEMALHHPVQLAIQTALLDNLSRGRLIVGTGRGSNYNAYEYRGFGTDIREGQQRLPEAEDLLIKAWTTEALEYHGTYWQVTAPRCARGPISSRIPPWRAPV